MHLMSLQVVDGTLTVPSDKYATLTKGQVTAENVSLDATSIMIAPWAQLASMATAQIPVSGSMSAVPMLYVRLCPILQLANVPMGPESSIAHMWPVCLQTWICQQSAACGTQIVPLDLLAKNGSVGLQALNAGFDGNGYEDLVMTSIGGDLPVNFNSAVKILIKTVSIDMLHQLLLLLM